MKKSNINKVLIVLPNWIGDAVLALPAICQIRDMFPSAHMTVLGLSHIGELFQESPYVDEINSRSLRGLLTTSNSIRESGFDIAILFPNSFSTALMTFLARIPYRCGYNRDGRGILLNIPVSFDSQIKRAHHVDYYLNIIRSIQGHKNPSPSPALHLSPDEIATASEILLKHGINADKPILGINPGAAYGSSKRWYPDRFARIAKAVAEKYNAGVILFGSRQEKGITDEIAGTAGIPLLNMAGKTTIRGLMSLIKHCNVFVTNDSGPMHIAAALGVPVVAIFGSTDPLITGPAGEGHVIIRKDVECSPCLLRECPTDLRCMDAISVGDVLVGVEKILKGIQ